MAEYDAEPLGARPESRQRERALAPAALGGLLLSAAGLLISIYLAIEHFSGNTSLSCPDTGAVNCLKVTTSPQSVVLGVPVPILGIVFFVVLLGLFSPQAWRASDARVHQARLAWVALGMLSVIYLVYVELFVVRALCLWCTGVHVITFLLLLLVIAQNGDSHRGVAARRR